MLSLKIETGRNCRGVSIGRCSVCGEIPSLVTAKGLAKEIFEADIWDDISIRSLSVKKMTLNEPLMELLRLTMLERPDFFHKLSLTTHKCEFDDEEQDDEEDEEDDEEDDNHRTLQLLDTRHGEVIREIIEADGSVLEELSMTGILFSCTSAKTVFSDSLGSNRSLVDLGLRGCRFHHVPLYCPYEDPAFYLAQGLRQCSGLMRLDLSVTGLTDPQLERLLDAVRGMKTLKMLDLEESFFGSRSFASLTQVLQHPGCRLLHLDVSSLFPTPANDNEDEGQEGEENRSGEQLARKVLLDCLGAGHSLEIINVSHNGLATYEELARMVHLAQQNPKLVTIRNCDAAVPTCSRANFFLRCQRRVWLAHNRTCHRFLLEAARHHTPAAAYPHCMARVNDVWRRLLNPHHLEGGDRGSVLERQATHLFPLVKALLCIPGLEFNPAPSKYVNSPLGSHMQLRKRKR